MDSLLKEYKETRKILSKALENSVSEEESEIIRSMLSDVHYTVEWLSMGKRPGNRRGIERRAAYQRDVPFCPIMMQKYFRSMENPQYSWDDHYQEDVISPVDKERIEEALTRLTPLEQETYLMVKGHCISRKEAAMYYLVSENTIKSRLKRAEEKITFERVHNIFCLSG